MKKAAQLAAGVILACGTLLAGCGGGVQDVSLPPASSTVTLAGVAAKGPLRNGTVKLYTASASGMPETLLATAVTDSQGRYSLEAATHSGPVIVVASGSYGDEATGQTRSIDPSAPLHAVLPCACATPLTVAVTPLTELAYQKAIVTIAGGQEVATAYSSATSMVSGLFSFDITTTQPVEPVSASLLAAGNARRAYTLTLAGISQMMKDGGSDLAGVIAALNSAGSNAPALVATALASFLNGNANNQTGYRNVSLSLALTGVAATRVSAFDLVLDLPAGATIPADASGTLSPFVFRLTGDAASAFFTTKYRDATGALPAQLSLSVITLNPLASGSFAILDCPLPAGTPVSSFAVRSLSAKDTNGGIIPGIGVLIQ